MFRFVSLFALVAVALAEPEADPQLLYNHVAGVPGVPGVNTYAAYAVNPFVPLFNTYATPVVKPVDPHHTEGMTKNGVPEKTDSVKIAEKQNEIAHEKSKFQYFVPHHAYARYPVYSSYVHHPYATHVVAKREADSESTAEAEADPYYLLNTYGGVPHTGVYNTAYHSGVYNAGVYSPYTAGVYNPYTHGVVGYKTPYTIHHLGKREADSDADAQYFYHGYRYPSAYNYGYNPYPYVYTTPYAYGARSVYGYHY